METGLREIMADLKSPSIIKPGQTLIQTLSSVVDGFFRGLLSQGVGKLDAPILASIYGAAYLIMKYVKVNGRPIEDINTATIYLQNFVNQGLVNNIGEIFSDNIMGPAGQALGEMAFPTGATGGELESKIKTEFNRFIETVKQKTIPLKQKIEAAMSGMNNALPLNTLSQDPISDRPEPLREVNLGQFVGRQGNFQFGSNAVIVQKDTSSLFKRVKI